MFIRKSWAPYCAPLISIILLVLGSGVSVTATTVAMGMQQATDIELAWVSSAFFLGVMISSYFCQPFIFRVKHIRAFAAFCGLCVVATLLQGLYYNIVLWVVLRFVVGYALACLYVIIESWLLGLSHMQNRGQILAVYMASFYVAQASGQWLLNLPEASILKIFVWIALFTAMSVIPLGMTRFVPHMPETAEVISMRYLTRRAALGVLGCILAGLILSVVYSFFPRFLEEVGRNAQIAEAMFVIIGAGALFQFPIGRLSDKYDRRLVLAICALVTALSGALMALFYNNHWVFLALCALLGGSAFMIYPISIAYTVDLLEPKHVLSATAALYIAYAIGACLGPVTLVPFLMLSDLTGYFIYTGITGLFLAAACLFWMMRVPRTIPRETSYFEPLEQTSVEASALDPRGQFDKE